MPANRILTRNHDVGHFEPATGYLVSIQTTNPWESRRYEQPVAALAAANDTCEVAKPSDRVRTNVKQTALSTEDGVVRPLKLAIVDLVFDSSRSVHVDDVRLIAVSAFRVSDQA
jgi:hypothetical protein